MTYGNFAYGSATIGGDLITTCGTPKANLVVMDQLLELGYEKKEALKLINLIMNQFNN